MNEISIVAGLSVCRLSVTIVDCGQTLRDVHVITRKHLCEVDIGLPESAYTLDLG